MKIIYILASPQRDWVLREERGRVIRPLMMMIALITIKSSLVPLIEGLCAQI